MQIAKATIFQSVIDLKDKFGMEDRHNFYSQVLER